MPKQLITVAFDLGGVVFSSHNDNCIFTDRYLETSLTDGIHDTISQLSKDPRYKLIVISKAFPNNARRSMEILEMYGLTKIFNSIIFCEHISDKFPIAKAMKVQLMIDDKPSVLATFDNTIQTFLFNDDTRHLLTQVIQNLSPNK